MPRTRALDYETKRQEILQQSTRLLAEHGYVGTSITMITDACGISRSLLYYYYPDKDAVVFDILYNNIKAHLAAAQKATRSLADPKENLLEIIFSILEFSQHNDLERVARRKTLGYLPEDRMEQIRQVERKLVAVLSKAIAEAVPSVGKGPLLKATTHSVFSMLNWHIRWFRDDGGLSRREYAQLIAQMILAGAPLAAADMPARTLPTTVRKKPAKD